MTIISINYTLKHSFHLAFSLKNYPFLLLAASLLGANIVNLNVGLFQLSPYRILIFLSPLLLFAIKKKTILQHREGINYGYFVFMLIWVIYSIIPLLWVKDYSGWARIFGFLLTGLITTWYIGWYLTTKEEIIKALKIIELFSVGFGLLALFEIISGNYLFVSERSLEYYQERSFLESTIGYRVPISVFGNPNDYSLFLLFAIFSSFGLSSLKKTRLSRFFSFLFTIFFIFLLIATQSRSAFIGLLTGVLAYFFVKIKHIKSKQIFKLLFGISITLIFLIPWLIENNSLFIGLLMFDNSTGSDETRINLIKNGIEFFKSSLFMGIGLGNIEYYMANYSIYPTNGVTNIHNFWMEILVSSGIFVFILYITIYLRNIWRLYHFSFSHTDKDMQILSMVFFCSFLGFFITSSGASSLLYNEWIWPIIAIIMSFINIRPSPTLK